MVVDTSLILDDMTDAQWRALRIAQSFYGLPREISPKEKKRRRAAGRRAKQQRKVNRGTIGRTH